MVSYVFYTGPCESSGVTAEDVGTPGHTTAGQGWVRVNRTSGQDSILQRGLDFQAWCPSS